MLQCSTLACIQRFGQRPRTPHHLTPPPPPVRRYCALSVQCPSAFDAVGHLTSYLCPPLDLANAFSLPLRLPLSHSSSSLPRTPSLGTCSWALKECLRTSREQPAPYDTPETGLSSCPDKRRISSALLGTPSPPCSKSVFCCKEKKGGKEK